MELFLLAPLFVVKYFYFEQNTGYIAQMLLHYVVINDNH
jgi:hypothetical protein